MKKFTTTAILIGTLLIASFATNAVADSRLTLKQERLLGLPNRFSMEVKDFPADGELSPASTQALVRAQLRRAGIKLLSKNSKPTPAKITVTINSSVQEDSSILYTVDVNVYNSSTIETEYNLRQGTVWKLGAYKVRASKNFPRNVEGKIFRMVKYFIYDYYTANPYLKPTTTNEAEPKIKPTQPKNQRPIGSLPR